MMSAEEMRKEVEEVIKTVGMVRKVLRMLGKLPMESQVRIVDALSKMYGIEDNRKLATNPSVIEGPNPIQPLPIQYLKDWPTLPGTSVYMAPSGL